MRIVFAIHHFLPNFRSGSEQHVSRIAHELRARGHAPRIVCVERVDAGPRGGVTWTDEVYEGLPVRRLSFDRDAQPDRRRWEYDNPWIGEHLNALLSAERPDVFQLFSGYLMTGRVLRVARDLAIPTVVTLTDFWFLCPRITMLRSDGTLSSPPLDPVRCARCLGEEQRRYRLPGRIAPRVMQRFWQRRRRDVQAIVSRQRFLLETLQQVDALISPSVFLRAMFIDQGVPAERITVCRQGIDLPRGLQVEPRARRGLLRVGYIGQIAPHKGVHLLVDAVRQLEHAPVVLRLYGDPSRFSRYAAQLQRRAAKDPRIEFAGMYQGSHARAAALADLDVIVVPSLWYDNNPMAINEALAHGLPVVAADAGSMPEAVIDGRNGLLFRRGDTASLAQQLRRLLDEPELLPALRTGITARPTVAQEVDHLENIYRRICAPRALRGEGAS